MTDNEITREKTFSEELSYFKERIKEVFDNYHNPNGYEDPLYIAVLRDSNRIVRKAEEEITRQQAENENLKVENQSLRSAANSLKMHYEEAQAEIERLRKEVNLVSIQFQDLQERYEEAWAEIERLKKLLTEEETKYNKCAKWFYKEAVKEFAERLKNEIINDTAYACDSTQHSGYYDYQIKIGDIPEYINNLVKEMVGDDNA